MKIPGANDSNPKKPVADVTTQPPGNRVGLLRRATADGEGTQPDAVAEEAKGKADSIQVSGLANALSNQFNPASMAAERSEKVKRLSDLIRSGKYDPKSEDVARAVSDELSIEILLGGVGKPAEDESQL
jgi:anti-sigma28 factor (negative regulator of flagellin synthesis)